MRRALSLSALLTLAACSIFAGDTHAIHAVVTEVGQSKLVLDHSGIPELLESQSTAFLADPNLSRQLKPGDRVVAKVLVPKDGGELRVIGVEVTGHSDPTPEVPPLGAAALQVGEVLPELHVPGVDGDIHLGAGQGEPTVLTFLFTTCPSPNFCPLLATKLAGLQGDIKGEGRIVSVTLDPETDSLGVLASYAQARGADPEVWTFGRLEKEPMLALLAQAGLSRVKTEGDILHSLHILVLDAEGRVSFRGSDNSWDPAEVAAAVRAGSSAAGAPTGDAPPAPR